MKKTVQKLRLWCAAAGVALLTGCTSVGTFDYSSASGTMVQFPERTNRKSVAVMPFRDLRSTKYFDPAQQAAAEQYPAGNHGSFYLGLIPLMPFGFVEKEEPENSRDFVSQGRFRFDPSQELAAAAMQSLKHSNLFSRVVKANTLEQADTDYVFQGTFSNLHYDGYLLSYCVTYFLSPALWILGAPTGVSYNELWVDFSLLDRKTGKTLWTYRFRGSDSITHWLYARIGKDTSLYAELMKRAMNGALSSLQHKLR